jgi:hypothetical protein
MADSITHDSAALRISGPEQTAEAEVVVEAPCASAAGSRRSRCLSRPRQTMEEGRSTTLFGSIMASDEPAQRCGPFSLLRNLRYYF